MNPSAVISTVNRTYDRRTPRHLAFYMAAALTASETLLFFARLRGYPEYTNPATGQTTFGLSRQWAPSGWFSASLLGVIGVSLVVTLVLALSAKPLPSVKDYKVPIGAYLLGSLFGALVRLFNGSIDVPHFALGAAPIVAALLIGALAAVEPKTLPPPRQLGLLYLLLGAMATAFAAIVGESWFFGLCYIVIWGGLIASAALVVEMVLGAAQT